MRGLSSVTVAAGLGAALLMPFDATAGQSFALDSVQGLQPHDVTVAAVTYQGRKAVRVMPAVAATAELSAPKNGEGGYGPRVYHMTKSLKTSVESMPVTADGER